MPADAEQAKGIREVASVLGEQHEFDEDAIAELQMAVDEACTRLIRAAVPGTSLVCRFGATRRRLRFTATAIVGSPEESRWSERGYGWHVLQNMVEGLSIRRGRDTEARHLLIVEFAKQVESLSGRCQTC
ncbi:ATP-binding protein [Rhodococcus sp. NPDC004095]